jgi:hypothetical protein
MVRMNAVNTAHPLGAAPGDLYVEGRRDAKGNG